jgi:hypothetical protein
MYDLCRKITSLMRKRSVDFGESGLWQVQREDEIAKESDKGQEIILRHSNPYLYRK